MWSSAVSPLSTLGLRFLLLLLGLIGGLWSNSTLSTFRSLLAVREVTDRIVVEDRFKPGVLTNIQAWLDALPVPRVQHPDVVRAKALVAVRKSQETMAQDGAVEADLLVEVAEQRVRSTLAQSPADSFLWQTLYSVATFRSGFDESNIQFLELSYATGPFEGWIASRRSRLALASFPMLSSRLQERVIAEFAALVDSDFIEVAVNNLETVGWAQRESLLAGLKTVDIESKERLSRRLSADGINVKVPDIEFDKRPWR